MSDELDPQVTDTGSPETESGPDDTAGQQADAGQPTEDHFFDPNNVPEELKPAYKQMQADYTRKTQSVAEQRRRSSARKPR